MPYVSTKVNIKITEEKEEIIRTKLSKAIEAILGKSENWIMHSFEDEHSLYFRGSKSEPTAFIEVKLFGKASGEAYNKMTGEITDIISSVLGINPLRVYVKYEETPYWGWNGNNF